MKTKGKRLGPGELDKLVLGHLKKHEADGPLTASAIGKGIERSSGAVAKLPRPFGESEEGSSGQAQAT